MSYPTVTGNPVEGQVLREPQSCLGTTFAQSTYQFFVTGTNTPANVYQDGDLTTPFPITGLVTADNFGRFPPIYLDTSIIYGVRFYNTNNQLVWTQDPYVPPLATTGTSSNSATGINIATTGEVAIPAPSSGGTGVTLTLAAGAIGSSPLQISSILAGNSALIINSSATTGAHTATFTATNKPGTATSSPAGWLPITCDGVQYYTPIWHGNNFEYYAANPSAQGQTIAGYSAFFVGDGVTVVTGGSASPGNWYSPTTQLVGANYFITLTTTSGLSGVSFGNYYTATAAPTGSAYTGGTLTAIFTGQTASNYTIQLNTGQLISGCTFTYNSATFSCPSTNISSVIVAPSASLLVSCPNGKTQNIGSGGIDIVTNSSQTLYGTYTISNSISGTPVLAAGSITLYSHSFGPTTQSYNGLAPLMLNQDGTATANGVSVGNWAFTQAGQGPNYWINISQTGGTPGYTFSAAANSWVNITSGGLSIGISGPAGSTYYVTGIYKLALDPAGVNIVASGSVTLNGGTAVQSPNWSGTPALVLASNGTTTLNGSSTSSWYSPTASGVGSNYWFNITRTGGTSGVNFTNAQGTWVNIGSGLTINLSGYTGDVGTSTASGTWNISSSATGSPVLGTGTISLSVSGGTVIHIYTSGSGTEVIPIGTTNVQVEGFGSGAGGGSGAGSGLNQFTGGGGGGGGFSYSSKTASSLGGSGQTFSYSVGVGGAAGSGGTNTTISAGTVTGWSTITAASGSPGASATGSADGAGGPGGTAAGGSTTNTTGNSGSTGSTGAGGAGITGAISGDGSPYGAGGRGGLGPGHAGLGGSNGAVVFFYT